MHRRIQNLLVCLLASLVSLSSAAQPSTDTAAAREAAAAPTPLRVCNDPDNWPLSHRDGTGLENRLAALLAETLGVPLHTEWITLQGRIVSATLSAGRCDVLMGVPTQLARVATTRPYYRSTFVWVQPADAEPLGSLADERLAGLRIGVPRIRHDDLATPPAWVLAQQGRARLVGFSLEEGRMPQRLVDAVAAGRVDAAVLWGAQAGWHVRRHGQALQLHPVAAPSHPELPMQVDFSLAVRPGNEGLRDQLEQVLDARRPQVEALLREFDVPMWDAIAPSMSNNGIPSQERVF
jgi:mxaJ protein